MHYGFFKGSHGGCRPNADQAGFALCRRTSHLHCKRDDLGEQDGRKHDEVLIAAENCVHNGTGTRKPACESLSHLNRWECSKAARIVSVRRVTSYLFAGAAMPRKTRIARLSRNISGSARRPIFSR